MKVPRRTDALRRQVQSYRIESMALSVALLTALVLAMIVASR